MKKTNLKEKLQNWKLGNYFRELSIVTAGVFITLAGTDFINSASQEKQINKSMQIWGIERSGFFNGREKWAKGFENQRV